MPASEPPRLSDPPAGLVEVELVPPPPPPPPPWPQPPPQVPPTSASGPPIHPIAALLLLVIDNLWNLADWAVIDWPITIPLSFLSVAVPTFLLQKKLLRQASGKAMGWALLLGGIAAVPFSVGGTTIGAFLLAWLGIRRLTDKPTPPL